MQSGGKRKGQNRLLQAGGSDLTSTGGRDADAPGFFAVAFDADAPDGRGQRVAAHALGPFDDDDGALVREQLVEVNRVCGSRSFVEAIEVYVVEKQSALVVSVDEREGRA